MIMSSKSAEKLKTCPQPETLAEFLAGKLPPDQQQSCEQHLENCDPCVETIRDLQVHDTFDDLARDAWMDSPQQEPVEADAMAVHDIIQRMQNLAMLLPVNRLSERRLATMWMIAPPKFNVVGATNQRRNDWTTRSI